MFIAVLLTITRARKQPRCPSADGQRMDKEAWCIYTMEYYSAMKINAPEVDEPGAYYTE